MGAGRIMKNETFKRNQDVVFGQWYWVRNIYWEDDVKCETGSWVLPVRYFKDGSVYVESYCCNANFNYLSVINLLTLDPPDWAPEKPKTIPSDWKTKNMKIATCN